ncbi:MAG TPA: peptidylprolyl isomerase [Spirochaetota bacterium]|nr:peptidylprolyl isomerase [Spirochaetota bacterium]HRZ27500.1 peptidylprolyl isomerase [Spirochaetota bacterium]HSA14763.1 peptidylprolyl isomerase [Spirochaetota bacterium]
MKYLSVIIVCLITAASHIACSKSGTKLLMQTSKGDILIELYDGKAPETVRNFLGYVDQGFYEGTVFHRVIPGFMIQGGGFTADLAQKETGRPIRNEATNGLSNERGTVVMARTAAPHSATAQFFINTKNNAFLDHGPRDFGYCVFGRVIKGMEVVDSISGTPTHDEGMYQNVPDEPVIIISVTRM